MNPAQRILIMVYLLIVALCCALVPWCIHRSAGSYGASYQRLGYGWIWAGPDSGRVRPEDAAPDVPLIQLRLLAVTAFCAAIYLLLAFNQERMRRLALLAGILGALTGLFFGYNKVQIMWRAHVQHSRFEVLMGRPAIQPVALLAKERWRYRNPHRYYSRWQYIEINDDTREIEGVTVDNTNGSISEFSLFSGEDVRDDTDRPFYAYFVIVLYPLIGFAIPWLGIRGIALVSAGVSKQK